MKVIFRAGLATLVQTPQFGTMGPRRRAPMDEGQYTPLFERIRERCRQEAQYPEQFSGFEQHAARIRGTTQTPTGLPWPPATEAQLLTSSSGTKPSSRIDGSRHG